MLKKVLIVNGPNLNLLGQRDVELYGSDTLKHLEKLCKIEAENLGLEVELKQSNHEGDIIEFIQTAKNEGFKYIILNAGAYSHTSIAILDAINDSKIPVIEVHISNIYKREKFRNFSYISKASVGVISGFGFNSYLLALYAIAKNS